MCTAATYQTRDFYFGRTFDYEFSYGESVTVMPRRFPLVFRCGGQTDDHYAMIGMAHIADGTPLFYDAVNEKGLGMAGLNFVGNAVYAPRPDRQSVAVFEFIPWVLSQCASVEEARKALAKIVLADTPFSPRYPSAQLHWLIADRTQAITVESVSDGLKVYDNPVGVMTNNPPFETQMAFLNRYLGLSPIQPKNRFSDKLALAPDSRGMGALGLPGDLSSASRFVRAAFVKMNSVSGSSEAESVSQFFHLLGSVDQPRGCCAVGDGFEITQYTSCCNTAKGVYYYTAYDNHRITAVDMHREDLASDCLISYPLLMHEDFFYQNA